MTADVYGAGEADLAVGRALAGLPRESFSLVGAVGHDFYGTQRDGSKGFPRFTSPICAAPASTPATSARRPSAASSAAASSASTCCCCTTPIAWATRRPPSGRRWPACARRASATRSASRPGPANGFTLDVIGCLERFGDLIDWAMLILNPLEPWPGRLALPACERHGVRVLARVVDYGGLFHDDVPDEGSLGETDHRSYRAAGWVDAGRARLDELRPIADRHGLTLLQLSAVWTLAQPAVACVAPTLIQEAGPRAKTVEAKRDELAAVPAGEPVLDDAELAAIAAIGDNTGCMKLKGASPVHEGDGAARRLGARRRAARGRPPLRHRGRARSRRLVGFNRAACGVLR